MDALDRANELMQQPMALLPERAMNYCRHLSNIYGFCGEIMITALCAYAQIDEGLSCGDSLYAVKDDDRAEYEKANGERG